jgi:hypothetical protein
VKRFAAWIVAGLACSLVAGCLLPEKFSASLDVAPDGGAHYRYDGTAVHIMALGAIQKNGALTAKEEADLQSEAARGTKDPGVKELRYLGKGRYQVSVDEAIKKGRQAHTLGIFSITQAKDGVYTIAGSAMKSQDVAQLQSLSLKIEGEMKVTLPPNAKVLSQNATSTPGVFGKAYVWKIGSVADKPQMTFTLGS